MAPDYCFSMTDPPFEFIAPAESGSGLIFLCDHASNRLPAEYGTLGLDPALMTTHIASDIGAAAVTRALAARFRALAVSRAQRVAAFVIDLQPRRGRSDAGSMWPLSDGSIVPGNRGAGADEIAERIARFHAPYHARIAVEIDAQTVRGAPFLS